VSLELNELVDAFAAGLAAADGRRPQAKSHRREGRSYRPGIGPFSEADAIKLALIEMRQLQPGRWDDAGGRRYPGSRQTCDLCVGDGPEWAIEVKLARVGRDNGTYEDTAVKKILSPYEDDRSAVTDCEKLAKSGFACRKGVVIYGFDDPLRPLPWLMDAFELVAKQRVALGERHEARFLGLVHPVFSSGAVLGWELGDSTI
jgi:hypothetical protein